MSAEAQEINSGIFLINEITYSGDQSEEFDARLHVKGYTQAPRDGLSEVTTDKTLFSDWHVPCHCLLAKTAEGKFQAFHVQPNKFGPTNLTYKQEEAMKSLGEQKSKVIAVKGLAGYFGLSDTRELSKMGIGVERVIDVKTSNWWRLLYNPDDNEIWIDIKDQHKLQKYRGFERSR